VSDDPFPLTPLQIEPSFGGADRLRGKRVLRLVVVAARFGVVAGLIPGWVRSCRPWCGVLLILALLQPGAAGVMGAERAGDGVAAQGRPWLPDREELTIAVTDSGLGGLSIMAELAARLEQARSAQRVHLVFFNALFSNESGYNSLPTRAAKLRVFDRALTALADSVRPDLIVIGCNTLSVIYPDTAFARAARVPVAGIIEPGVALFRRELARQPAATLLLFGTETTIGENTHRNALLAAGIPAARIVPKACPELAAYIEHNWQGDDTDLMIASVVGDVVGALPAPKPPVLVGLVCSHYGYARESWPRAVAEGGTTAIAVLDPNRELVESICPSGATGRHARTTITAQVVSMVEIGPEKRRSLGTWLRRVSPVVADALENYDRRPQLFDWKSAAQP
jgi:glutamate racemase